MLRISAARVIIPAATTGALTQAVLAAMVGPVELCNRHGLLIRAAGRVNRSYVPSATISSAADVVTQPLDYERVEDTSTRSMTARRWALGLALAAGLMDGIALAAASGDGGRGWAFAFPCVCGNGLLATACALASACVALIALTRRKGRDALAWFALLLAAGTACGGIIIAMRSMEAVAAV